MCPDWIQMREMKCRWFHFGSSSQEAHAAWISPVSYLLVSSSSSTDPTYSHLQASPMFPLTTAPPGWTVKETRHLCLSGFQALILSKTSESHSNPVPGVISSLQMKMQIQLAYILPNSMYAVSRLLAPALRKCLWNKKYQAQRFSWKSVAILWTATSASLAILTSLIALQIQKKTT